MDIKDNLSLVICSCDSYSDLWYPQIRLLNEYWGDRDIETYLVTDIPTEKTYPNVKIIYPSQKKNFSGRLAYALDNVRTEYTMVVLDDYFLFKTINNHDIEDIVLEMSEKDISYYRLYPIPFEKISDLYREGSNRISYKKPYSVNLYPSIWKTKHLFESIQKDTSAWEFEVDLTDYFHGKDLNSFYSKGNEYPFINGVVQGKFFRKSIRYLHSKNLYTGKRSVLKISESIIYRTKRTLSIILPLKVKDKLKKILKKIGFRFYSK